MSGFEKRFQRRALLDMARRHKAKADGPVVVRHAVKAIKTALAINARSQPPKSAVLRGVAAAEAVSVLRSADEEVRT